MDELMWDAGTIPSIVCISSATKSSHPSQSSDEVTADERGRSRMRRGDGDMHKVSQIITIDPSINALPSTNEQNESSGGEGECGNHRERQTGKRESESIRQTKP
ncbi:hypothetical protein BLNAU_20772 [Blattamonas nauphoetae]|uniref:Uncharacterized protein n=1 Tax=Blattamonas nauphoetae TaxID=2049346 RepID=A0ABQ9WXT7_9EUKA|nr:hypothetical protein BLNAU_20772 [Blattamonas nauphoetae]